MQTFHIIAGFSDIKSELRTRAQISKSLQQLELWFTCDENVLYVHDYDDHQKCVVLAIYNPRSNLWNYFLRKGSFGELLVKQKCESTPVNLLADVFYKLYRLYGFIPFGSG